MCSLHIFALNLVCQFRYCYKIWSCSSSIPNWIQRLYAFHLHLFQHSQKLAFLERRIPILCYLLQEQTKFRSAKKRTGAKVNLSEGDIIFAIFSLSATLPVFLRVSPKSFSEIPKLDCCRLLYFLFLISYRIVRRSLVINFH